MDLFVVDCGDSYERDLVGVAVDRAGAVALARDYVARGWDHGGYFSVRVVRAGELAGEGFEAGEDLALDD
jgi:hypothetical protein